MTAKFTWLQKSRLPSWWEKIRSGLHWLWQKIKQHPFAMGIIVVLFLIAFTFAAYQWKWTGFNGGYPKITMTTPLKGGGTKVEEQQPANTLWDWMQLLVVPIMIAIGGFWLNQLQVGREKREAAERVKRAEAKVLLQQFVQAYNDAKGVRRLLRATALYLSPDDAIMITRAPYSEQMQELIDIQLQFETFIDEVESNPTLFSRMADPDTLKCNLGSIEKYLNSIVGEYEDLYKMHPNATPTLPISNLPKLKEFIGKYRDAIDFRTKFKAPAHEVMAVLNLLTSE